MISSLCCGRLLMRCKLAQCVHMSALSSSFAAQCPVHSVRLFHILLACAARVSVSEPTSLHSSLTLSGAHSCSLARDASLRQHSRKHITRWQGQCLSACTASCIQAHCGSAHTTRSDELHVRFVTRLTMLSERRRDAPDASCMSGKPRRLSCQHQQAPRHSDSSCRPLRRSSRLAVFRTTTSASKSASMCKVRRAACAASASASWPHSSSVLVRPVLISMSCRCGIADRMAATTPGVQRHS